MLDAGVCVTLGGDSGNGSNHFDMLRLMYLAATLYKDARLDVAVMPPERALEMATRLGAEALLLGGAIGSIEPGKRADLVLYDLDTPEWRPLLNPVNNLVYAASGASVRTVLIDGRVVLDEGRLITLDERALYERARDPGAPADRARRAHHPVQVARGPLTPPPPLERWFQRVFGDAEGQHVGSGWMSGTASVFLGGLALLGVAALWFPGAFSSAAFRAHYPMPLLRALLEVTIGLAFLLGTLSLVLRRRKILGLVGIGLALAATLAGGGSVPIESRFDRPLTLGLDWFLLSTCSTSSSRAGW